MATHGSLGEFDPKTGDWKTYIERTKQYFLANDVNAEDKQRAILLWVTRLTVFSRTSSRPTL